MNLFYIVKYYNIDNDWSFHSATSGYSYIRLEADTTQGSVMSYSFIPDFVLAVT
jgi:hypothetical protein